MENVFLTSVKDTRNQQPEGNYITRKCLKQFKIRVKEAMTMEILHPERKLKYDL